MNLNLILKQKDIVMVKQEFSIGQAVRCTLSSMKGVHVITSVKLCEEENYRGEPSASFLKYQLDGNENMWSTSSYLEPFVDVEMVEDIVKWLRDHIKNYLCCGEKGNLFAKEELYKDLLERFTNINEY